MKNKRFLGGLLAFLMLFNIGSAFPMGVLGDPTPPAPSGTDWANSLLNETLVISQEGVGVIGEGKKIDLSKDINLSLNFSIPFDITEGNPELKVKFNDHALYQISELLQITGGTPSYLSLKTGTPEVHVASAYFTSDGLFIVFDGDVFKEAHPDEYNINCTLDAALKFTGSPSQEIGEGEAIVILGKTYYRAPIQTKYDMVKTGAKLSSDQQYIDWEVKVSATKYFYGDNQHQSLADLVFYDSLSGVGDYDPNTFKIKGPSDSSFNEPIGWTDPGASATELSYTFPGGTMSPQTITFRTKTSDQVYVIDGGDITNTAHLLKNPGDTTALAADDDTKSYIAPTWITKTGSGYNEGSGGSYNPTDRKVKWEIAINPNNLPLKQVHIIDPNPSPTELEWDSAVWTGGGTVTPPAPSFSGYPANGDYSIGDITAAGTLTIIYKVKNTDTTLSEKTFTNNAQITVDGTKYGEDDAEAKIGYPGFTKAGSIKDRTTGTITWNVNLDPKGQAMTNIKIYDLFVYGSSSISLSDPGLTASPSLGSLDLSTLDLPKENYRQKYLGDFTVTSGDTTGVQSEKYVLSKGGKAIADLLVITLPDNTARSFRFDSQITDPAYYAGRTNTTIYNTAKLIFDEGSITNGNNVTYNGNSLSKTALRHNAGINPNGAAASSGNGNTDAFNYPDKSVVYKLLVNGNGMNLTSTEYFYENSLSSLTLVDTLPVGWEFRPIGNDDKDFLIFEANTSGTASAGAIADPSGFVTMTKVPPAGTEIGKTDVAKATFTFTQLDKPYVILLKAGPASAEAEDFFSKNASKTFTNNAKLYYGDANGTLLADHSHTNKVTSTLFDKRFVAGDGFLTWTIDYNPYELNPNKKSGETEESIEDILPEGLDLRTDSYGKLSLADSGVRAYELTMNSAGVLSESTPVNLILAPAAGHNISYDSTSRTLVFKIPDSTKAYRLTYITDITTDTRPLTNQAKLVTHGQIPDSSKTSYVVSSGIASATMERGGRLAIIKQDGSTKLEGAQFTLFATNPEQTVIRQGKTKAGTGELAFYAIPKGTYTLKETLPPPGGYTLRDPQPIYTVIVSESSGVITTTINGTPVNIAPDKKVTNPLIINNHRDGTVGSLTVSKAVEDYYPLSEATRNFDFELTLQTAGGADINGTYTCINGSGSPLGTITTSGGKAAFQLSPGQKITILGLPKNAKFTVEEKNDPALYVKPSYQINGGVKTNGSITPENTITADTEIKVDFTNTRRLGDLTLTKTAEGFFPGADAKPFKFTLTLREQDGLTPLKGTYAITGDPGRTLTDISGITSFALASNDSITIGGLPEDAKYFITETGGTDKYSSTTYEISNIGGKIRDGAGLSTKDISSLAATDGITVDDNTVVTFKNLRETGNLSITKNVQGSYPADVYDAEHKKFAFSLKLTEADGSTLLDGSYTYSINKADTSLISSGTITPTTEAGGIKAFELAHNDTITIHHLPKSAKFTITETYSGDEYTETSWKIGTSEYKGKIAGGSVESGKAVTFINTRNTDDLIISKDVVGHYPQSLYNPVDKLFRFTLELKDKFGDDLKGSYFYSLNGSLANQTFSGHNLSFELADGDSITIKDLPEDAEFTITEIYNGDQYVITDHQIDADDYNGTIATGLVGRGRIVAFTNTRETGHLTLSKTVVGNLRDPHQKFKFTLSFMESDKTTPHSGIYSYTANGAEDDTILIPGSTITIPAGGIATGTLTIPADGIMVFELEKDQFITIDDLPKDIEYSITEEDYQADRITTAHRTDDGSEIIGLEVKGPIKGHRLDTKITFKNTRRPGTAPTDPETPTQPTTPTVPTQPTIPTEPTQPTAPTEPTEPIGPTVPTGPTEPQPTYPTLPTEEVEDPNNPDSPDDFILIDENGTPQGRYTKTPQPDGSYIYLDENGIPLGKRPIPRTGDQTNLILWAIMLTLSLAGAGWLLIPQFSLGRSKH